MKLKQGFFLWSILAGGIAVAAPSAEQVQKSSKEEQRKYFTMGEPTIELVDVSESPLDIEVKETVPSTPSRPPLPNTPSTPTTPNIPNSNSGVLSLDRIINLGKTIWAIVEAGRPVGNFKTDSASALPEGLQGWSQLDGWHVPKTQTYRVSYKNLYGMTVVSFDFRIMSTYGGAYKDIGKYLARVAILPDNIDVAWGYTFNATASVPNVYNAGTSADPIAAAEVYIDWEVKTVARYNRQTESFYVDGTGLINKISE